MKNQKRKNNFDFKGVTTALITPFLKGEVDTESLARVVRDQLDNGIQGFVVNGTTAESPTLSADEVAQVFVTVEKVSDRAVPILLGTGSNSTQKTIEQTKWAEDLGADAALVVVPYYNKPPQRGLVAHYTAVAESSELPIILYNVPSRTITGLSLESIRTLAKVESIVGIKEATGDMTFDQQIIADVPKSFVILSGDDESCMDLARLGGHGVIAVGAHVFPREFVTCMESARSGQPTPKFIDLAAAIKALYLEANPIPVKMALYLKGLIRSPELRLPLTTMDEGLREKMQTELRKVGALK